ncbi:MAG: DEAD/DEAH box helicase [Planctomycetes bacterium]|nr:DEAD/DEAH box helicase [Planctomycetota bacterium]
MNELAGKPWYRKQIALIKRIPARCARYSGEVDLPEALRKALRSIDIERLYTHQTESLRIVRSGANLVVVTGTASGKTLCYNLPILETLCADPSARALYLFPTKALTQDQTATLNRLLAPESPLAGTATAAIYDGDTPKHQRSRIRQNATILLSNPDMLHVGILPYHPKWAHFLRGLKYVVIDEIHTYRGIFGSHVANCLRRLKRVAAHYGAKPQFIASSATIANPKRLAEALADEPFDLVDEDASPQGEKFFVIWNPPVTDTRNFLRRSSNVEASQLLAELVKNSSSTILFARARIVTELVHRYTVERLKADKATSALAGKVSPYRGGYLPEDRRRIERELFSGRLLAVSSTNALELGIDVGSLDAAILVGYPGTRAAFWQQAGRAGRRGEESLAILVPYDEPIDQFIAHRGDFLFDKPVEEAIIDPENAHILQGHVLCAAAEKPLDESDASFLGDKMLPVADALEKVGKLKQLGGKYYLSSPDFPAAGLNLRLVSSDTYEIVDITDHKPTVIGNVDSISAPELVYPGAVYLHEGTSYLCERLDVENKVAAVRRGEVDYYTQPILASAVKVASTGESRRQKSYEAFLGDIDVTWATVGLKKIRFLTQEMIGQGELDLPEQTLVTRAVWIMPHQWVFDSIADLGCRPDDGMVGAKNLLLVSLAVLAMSDPRDIFGIVSARNTPRAAIYLYDHYPGGIGYAEKGYDGIEDLLARALDILKNCPCPAGCPSCVGLPNLRPPLHHNPELHGGPAIPDKLTTEILLETLLSGGSSQPGDQ